MKKTATKYLELVIEKVSSILDEYETVTKSLLNFGWKDERPKKTRNQTITRSVFDINDTITTTIPASAIIPESFVFAYNKWYSGALALVESNVPTRILEFNRIHKGDITLKGASSIISEGAITDFSQRILEQRLRELASIVHSIPSYLESHLYDMELSIAQVYMNDELNEALALIKARHVRAAGAVAGVILERHLKLLCDRHKPPIQYLRNAGISKLNDLLKNNNYYDQTQWRKVQWMGDVRNSCDHSTKDEPRPEDVSDLIKEVKKFIALFVI
jgi:hypothetical protein